MDTVQTTNYNAADAMQRGLAMTIEAIPKVLLFLLVLVVGYFVARALGKVIDALLTRVGFDRMVERGGIKQALSQSGIHVSDILGKIVFYAIFLFVLQLAFSVFGPNAISDLLNQMIAFLPNLFVALVIVVIAAAVSRGVGDIVRASLGGLSYGNMLANVAAISIIVIGVFAALTQLGVATAIVLGLFYAILAIVAGSAIVAIGGGGIQPMRTRWENTLNRIDQEIPKVKGELQPQVPMTPEEQEAWRRRQGYVS